MIRATRKWTYTVYPYGNEEKLAIAEIDAKVPGLIGLNTFKQWGIDLLCSREPPMLSVRGVERPISLADSGHPQIDLFGDRPRKDFCPGRAATRRPLTANKIRR